MPKILMFGWELPPFNSGGLGVACFGLAKALSGKGVHILFVLPKPIDIHIPFFKVIFAHKGEMCVQAIESLLQPYITSREYAVLQLGAPHARYGNALLDEVRRYALQARDIALREEFDVIHAHDWLSFLAGIEAKRVSGKPLIVHVHATEFDRTGGSHINHDVYQIERHGMHEADQVIAVSHFTKKILVDHYAVPAQKVAVVYNGIDEQEMSGAHTPLSATTLFQFKQKGYKVVLFVGRLTLQKGADYFLKAAQVVLRYNKNVLFVVAGSGDMETQIIDQAAALGIGDKIIFTGFVRGEELTRLYCAADLFVMPSVSEPFGMTTLESLSLGTPVLVSKQSGVAETLNHALKVDFWDTDEMANKIVSVLRYPPLHTCLSQNGSYEVKRYTWEKAAEKIQDIYTCLCAQPLSLTVDM